MTPQEIEQYLITSEFQSIEIPTPPLAGPDRHVRKFRCDPAEGGPKGDSAEQSEAYLDSFINYELSLGNTHAWVFKLDRIQALLQLLGNPQNNLKFIHVAGSKGKGSVCALTASILKEAGYKVGLYTSPHLYSFKERIRILSKANHSRSGEIFSDSITDRELNAILEEIRPQLEKMRSTKKWGVLTFFEVLTALALVYFFKKRVDWVVLETGLGGRWDATNAVSSSVCVLTPISLEHTQILGNTIRKIAAEKAAIIKDPQSKVVVAPQEKEAALVIKKRCEKFGIRPLWIGKQMVSKIKSQKMSLLGEHQRVNASVAVGIIESLKSLGVKVPPQAISRGLKKVYWPGRLEIIRQNPLVVLDGAHNGASAKVLARSLRTIFPGKKVVLILGVSSDKNKKDIIEELSSISSCVIFTRANHPRASYWEEKEVEKYLAKKDFSITSRVEEALKLAFARSRKDDIILVAGSLFLVAEARKYVQNELPRSRAAGYQDGILNGVHCSEADNSASPKGFRIWLRSSSFRLHPRSRASGYSAKENKRAKNMS